MATAKKKPTTKNTKKTPTARQSTKKSVEPKEKFQPVLMAFAVSALAVITLLLFAMIGIL